MHCLVVPTCVRRASRGPTASHILSEHSSAFYHAVARRFVFRAVTTALNSSYGPQLIMWPGVRQFPPRSAEIVARSIRNRCPPRLINRGAGVNLSPPPHSPSSSSPPRSTARRALRPRTEPHDAGQFRRDKDLAVEPQPTRRRQTAGASPLRILR